MKLRIQHETVYSYTRSVRFGPHRLVIRPREGHDVRVESMNLSSSPVAEVTWTRDVFGNSIASLFFPRKAARELRIAGDVVITRTTPYQHRKHDTEPTPWPPIYDPLEIAVVAAYQQLSYPADADAVGKWLKPHSLKLPATVAEI